MDTYSKVNDAFPRRTFTTLLTHLDKHLRSDDLGHGIRNRIRSELGGIRLDVPIFALDERKTTPLGKSSPGMRSGVGILDRTFRQFDSLKGLLIGMSDQ